VSVAQGKRVRDLRTAKGWTLREFSEKVGLSVSFLSDFERGSRGTSDIASLAGVLGVDADELYALDGRLAPEISEWLSRHPHHSRTIRAEYNRLRRREP